MVSHAERTQDTNPWLAGLTPPASDGGRSPPLNATARKYCRSNYAKVPTLSRDVPRAYPVLLPYNYITITLDHMELQNNISVPQLILAQFCEHRDICDAAVVAGSWQ